MLTNLNCHSVAKQKLDRLKTIIRVSHWTIRLIVYFYFRNPLKNSFSGQFQHAQCFFFLIFFSSSFVAFIVRISSVMFSSFNYFLFVYSNMTVLLLMSQLLLFSFLLFFFILHCNFGCCSVFGAVSILCFFFIPAVLFTILYIFHSKWV